MNPKNIQFELGPVNKMKAGADILANAVRGTLGPKGKNVIFERPGTTPIVTKDGVTVAKEVFLKDPLENMGAQMVKQVALKTAQDAGDGTTTATVLAQGIIHEGLKMVTVGGNPIDIKKGIDKAVVAVVEFIKTLSIDVKSDSKEILRVATVSANGDEEIGGIIAEAYAKIGVDGVVTIETSNDMRTHLEYTEGISFERGYTHPYFVSNAKGEAVLENVRILLYDKKLGNLSDILKNILHPIFNNREGLLIIAEAVEGELMASLIANRQKSSAPLCVSGKPSYGDNQLDIMEDIAAMCGTQYFTEAKGMDIRTVESKELGFASKVIVTRDRTVITGAHSDKQRVDQRIEELKTQIADDKIDAQVKENYQNRLARLTNGVAVIKVGAPSDVELKEKKDRVEDAREATKSALAEGIVPGGGVTLIRAIPIVKDMSDKNPDINTGIRIIEKALEWPLRQIVKNAGLDEGRIIDSVKEGSGAFGYDARSERFGNLIEAGVIDPTKVVRVCLENAASVAGMFLTSNCVIHNEPEPEGKIQMLGSMPMG